MLEGKSKDLNVIFFMFFTTGSNLFCITSDTTLLPNTNTQRDSSHKIEMPLTHFKPMLMEIQVTFRVAVS